MREDGDLRKVQQGLSSDACLVFLVAWAAKASAAPGGGDFTEIVSWRTLTWRRVSVRSASYRIASIHMWRRRHAPRSRATICGCCSYNSGEGAEEASGLGLGNATTHDRCSGSSANMSSWSGSVAMAGAAWCKARWQRGLSDHADLT